MKRRLTVTVEGMSATAFADLANALWAVVNVSRAKDFVVSTTDNVSLAQLNDSYDDQYAWS